MSTGRTTRPLPVADRAQYAADLQAARAELARVTAELDQAHVLIAELTDPDPCTYDHHGYCQAHGWPATMPSCPHARAKELTAAVPGSPPRAQEPATPDTRDKTGRERGCTCALTGPAAAPRIAEIDTQCPLHGRLVAVDALTEEDRTDGW